MSASASSDSTSSDSSSSGRINDSRGGSGGTESKWQFLVDRGGTFTDIVARRPDGSLATAKLLSENPERYRDAAVAGIRHLLGLADYQAIDPQTVEVVKMGTTVATNALLERKGEPVLLVTTTGFRDALRIAYQNRPKLFEREIVLPELLYRDVVEVDERVSANGEIVRPIDLAKARVDMLAAYQRGLRAIAIVLMHGYRYPAHEQKLAAMAVEIGFPQISVSHRVSPLIKFVARATPPWWTPTCHRCCAVMSSRLPARCRRCRYSSCSPTAG